MGFPLTVCTRTPQGARTTMARPLWMMTVKQCSGSASWRSRGTRVRSSIWEHV